MSRLRIGTRGSKLALWQAHHVANTLKKMVPGLRVDLEVMKTQGDKILDVALSRIGDKGLFTKEIEIALIENKVDLAVHSMKDLPSVLEPGLCLGAVLHRENPQDVLLSSRGYSFADLPHKAVVGTSSLRRIAQIKARRPDIVITDLRGNVDTRIRKMEEEGLDGIILAMAGVKRLGYQHRITDCLSQELILPAVGQGAIGVEIRAGDCSTQQLVHLIDDADARYEVEAERAFLRVLEGGCQVPVGSLARVAGPYLTLHGLIASVDGKQVYRGQIQGDKVDGEQMGRDLARQLLARGGAGVLEDIKRLGEHS